MQTEPCLLNASHCHRHAWAFSRRDFLRQSAFGFGASALGFLSARDAVAATNPLAPKPPHFPGKAKCVVLLFMTGGPSHLETFDPKPALVKYNGQPLPESFKAEGLALQNLQAGDGKLLASPFKFEKHGESGLEISSLFPRLAEHADDLAVIRSCHHESFIHGPALGIMHTGSTLLGHPSTGAWVTYGLGSATDNLPAYMTMTDGGFRAGAAVSYGSGFLPAIYQGTVLRAEGAPISNLTPPTGGKEQRSVLDALHRWNGRFAAERPDDSRLIAQLANYELAYRMQTAAPDLVNLGDETAATRALYGVDQEPTAKFGRMCLLARRMAERGVRRGVADAIYDQLAAFANYGFPESHAVSFAYLVYASAWFKRHYPAVFLAALLNAQPMGFWSPQSLVADARRHGVVVLGPDVNESAS
ncbi:MAG TPA: DUF1501 domain-containing protein, partial [Pirellulales bacterium]|nr:DUF1501 domain-containing protein [Pirellulales bacterium]